MAMSLTLQKFLAQHGIAYEVLPHPYTVTSMNTASSARVPGDKLAKPVILEDEQGYIMAVIPANRHVKIGEIRHMLKRNIGLATESELQQLFPDCDLGAVPPIGQAYGMETIVDDSLIQAGDIYFEAGDHEDVIHIKGAAFRRLMKHVPHGSLCMH